MSNSTEKKLKDGVKKYEEVKRCLKLLDKNLDEKEDF